MHPMSTKSSKAVSANPIAQRRLNSTASAQTRLDRLAGLPVLLTFSVPQFFFYPTTAYDIQRHCGVELAKKDFPGKPGQ
jgi:hypothetical protein